MVFDVTIVNITFLIMNTQKKLPNIFLKTNANIVKKYGHIKPPRGVVTILSHFMNGKQTEKEQTMSDTTKISISKELHIIIKKICAQNGLKMQFFEDRAIEAFIGEKYPLYMNGYKSPTENPLNIENQIDTKYL